MRCTDVIAVAATFVLAACGAGAGSDVSAPGGSADHPAAMSFETIPYGAIGPNKIVFHRTIGNQAGVVIADGATASIRSTVSPGGANIAASPGGKKIAYEHAAAASETARGTELFVRDIAGSDAIALGGPGAERAQPSWSPDGTRLVFIEHARTEQLGTSIVSQQSGSGGARDVLWQTTDCQYAEHPSQNARGDLVFVYYPGDGGCALRQTIAVKAPGGAVQVLVDAPTSNFIFGAPAWSPSGNEIAFIDLFGLIAPGKTVSARLNVMNADGSNPRIYPVGTILYSPAAIPLCWAADGTRLFFTLVVPSAANPPVAHVYSIRKDGTSLTQITSAASNDEWLSCP